MHLRIGQIYDVIFIIFVSLFEIEHFFGTLNNGKKGLKAYSKPPSKLKTADTDLLRYAPCSIF